MAMKHDFNITNTSNVFADTLIYTSQNSHNLVIYTIIIVIGFILAYVFYKKTDDGGIAFNYSLFACTLLSILLYYMGKIAGAQLFNGNILITMILILISSTAFQYYERNRIHGD